MNRLTRPRSTSGCLLALILPLGLAACGVQDNDDAFSQIALPTFSKDRVAKEAPVEVRRMLSSRDVSFDFNALDPSPDGRHVTGIEWDRGDLAVIELATGEKRRVTNNENESGGYPDGAVFSPDGSRIAYVWQGEPTWNWELRTIGMDGTDMKVHLSFPSNEHYEQPQDWSKDGRYILITLYQEGPTQGDPQIVTLDVVTNEVRVLQTVESGPTGSFFSPDGRFVAFDLRTEKDSRESDIFLVSSDGTRRTALIQTPDHETLLGWLPDGSGILFHRIASDSRAIWKLPVQDGRPAGPPELVKDDVWRMTGFGFSDDAYFYGLTVSHPGVQVGSIDPETGRVLEPMTPVAELSGPRISWGAGWSPDGLRFAYLQADAGETRVIVRSVTGELLEQLAIPLRPGGSHGVRWTAYGLLVEGRDLRDGHGGYHLLSLETGEMRFVTESVGTQTPVPTVSEDGSRIFVGRMQWAPIIEHDLATGTERTLVEHEAQIQSSFPDTPEAAIVASTVSPDGDHVAYTVGNPSGGDKPMAIEISSLSNGNVRAAARLAWTAGYSSLAWSPDSRYVFFVGRLEDGDPRQLMRLSAEDGSLRSFPALFGGDETVFRVAQPRVSSDGRHISVTGGEIRQEIWRMTFNGGG